MDLEAKISQPLDTLIAQNQRAGNVLPAPSSSGADHSGADAAASAPAVPASSGAASQGVAAPTARGKPRQVSNNAGQPYVKRTRAPNSNQRNNRGRGANSARGAPAPRQGDESRGNVVDATGRRILSVAHTSNVKSVAGSISHISRESDPPSLQSVGSMSTNQAIKAIAIARTYVENDGLDFTVEPARVPDETMKNLVQLRLEKRPARETPEIDPVELKIAATTESAALAGAIANNVREGRRVRITAVGSIPVFRAVDSIIKARAFLEKDGLDLRFQPAFTTIEAGDGSKINAVTFSILFQQI